MVVAGRFPSYETSPVPFLISLSSRIPLRLTEIVQKVTYDFPDSVTNFTVDPALGPP